MSTLSPEGVHSFLEVARETPYYSLFHTALYTGMRRGELLALRWKDVDLDKATLSVVRSIYRGSGGDFTVREPKTQRSRRLIALSPSLVMVLRDHQAERRARSILIGKTIPELIFSHLDGSPLDPSTVSHAFGKVIKKARVPSVRFHDLRHTHATLMMKQGINPKVVSERLGHSTVAMTLDLYSHVVPGLQEQAALRFDEGLQREVGALGTENGAGGFG
ncbi:MAG: site-specific integrase [Chloroflexi bacterium]|nr:site-specific integrase [Chloroflexota bacterium]